LDCASVASAAQHAAGMFVCGFGLESVANFLQLADALQLQATGTFARKVCLEEAVWSDIMAREFHGFGLSPALLQPPGWRILSHLFRELHQAQVTVDSRPHVHFDETTVQQLIAMLRSADQSMKRPKTFVGVMRFPPGSLPSSLNDPRRVQPAEPPSGIGDAFSLRLHVLDTPSGATRSSVSEDPAELTLHFGWQNNNLQLAVRDDGSPPGAHGPEARELRNEMRMGRQGGHRMIAVDVAACSSAMTLHYRGVSVMVNGPWTICQFGLSIMRAAAIDALAKGVPCVVCDRMAKTT